MPIYEYRRPDGSTFEVVQSFSEDPLTRDPETGVAVQRVLHPPAVHFKGKGFYNTDYGTRKRQRESASSGEGSSSGEAGGGGEKGSGGSGDGGGDGPAKEGSSGDGGGKSSTTSEGKSGGDAKGGGSGAKKSESVAAKG